MIHGKRLCLSAASALLFFAAAAARDWPKWRGVNQDGTTTEGGWSASWGEAGPKVLWDVTLARGYASICVVDGRVYTMGGGKKGGSPYGSNNNEETVYCLDAGTGKEIWTYTYAMTLKKCNKPVYAGGTPTVVKGLVYTYGNGADLHCLDAKTGKVIWHTSMRETVKTSQVSYGYNASPAVAEGVVAVPIFPDVVARDGNGVYPCADGEFIGVSAKDGKEVWRVAQTASAWGLPVVGKLNGKVAFVYVEGQGPW